MARKNNSYGLLDILKSLIKDSLAEFKTAVINIIETHIKRPVSLEDRESYYNDFGKMGKTKDIEKKDLKSNKSDDIPVWGCYSG